MLLKKVNSKVTKIKSLLLNCLHIDPSHSKQVSAFSNIVKLMVTYIVLPKNILFLINLCIIIHNIEITYHTRVFLN